MGGDDDILNCAYSLKINGNGTLGNGKDIVLCLNHLSFPGNIVRRFLEQLLTVINAMSLTLQRFFIVNEFRLFLLGWIHSLEMIGIIRFFLIKKQTIDKKLNICII